MQFGIKFEMHVLRKEIQMSSKNIYEAIIKTLAKIRFSYMLANEILECDIHGLNVIRFK